jgi:hypothetical protein
MNDLQIAQAEYAEPGEWHAIKRRLNRNPVREVSSWYRNITNPQKSYNDMARYKFGYKIVCKDGKLYPDEMGRAAQIYFGLED